MYSFEDAALIQYLNVSANLVQKLSYFVHVSVGVDVPQSPRYFTGVFQPLSYTLIEVLLLQTLQHS